MHSPRVMVVGTTSDYIELVRRRYPQRALFLTDPGERKRAGEETPLPGEEILCDLTTETQVLEAIQDHLSRYRLAVDGVACFDCEFLGFAAVLADRLGLPFPSAAAVTQSRNKFLSKQAWKKFEVDCPEGIVVRSRQEIREVVGRMGSPLIMKPLTGSGGELVFLCKGYTDCLKAYDTALKHLSEAGKNRLYMMSPGACGELDPLRHVMLEEFIPGHEYSCDFFLENGRIEVIRTAKKIPLAGVQVGETTAAYVVPSELPEEIPTAVFLDQLHRATAALGIYRALCMVDFIICQGKAYLLELTPRPGGDCLPWLIRQSCGLDMIGLALDIAQGRHFDAFPKDGWQTLVGLRLIARHPGIIKEIDDEGLCRDPRVQEIFIKRKPGHKVVLPPNDYDSRILGHVIFKPTAGASLEMECTELAGKFKLAMEIKG